jgi:hypothetical protein
VLDKLVHRDEHYSQYDAFLSADMRTKTSWAIPYRLVAPPDIVKDPWLLRAPDGCELFSDLYGFEAFIEDPLWKTLVGGARLPAALVAEDSVAFTTEPIPIRSSTEWKLEWPRKSCQLWSNEGFSGVRLLDAEKREGPDMYLSREPVVERTPPGFVMGEGGSLEGVPL